MIGIFSYKPLKNVKRLAKDLGIRYANEKYPRDFNKWDKIINWGCSAIDDRLENYLNEPYYVDIAINKLFTYSLFEQAGIPTVTYTTSQEQMQEWLNQGNVLIGRTILRGTKGKGIVIIQNKEVLDKVENIKVATILKKQAREYRFHVFGVDVREISQKKRRLTNLTASGIIKNRDNGWVFCYNNLPIPRDKEGCQIAVSAVRALGLDFGAVDMLYHKSQWFALEVNTAPSLRAPITYKAYLEGLKRLLNEKA